MNFSLWILYQYHSSFYLKIKGFIYHASCVVNKTRLISFLSISLIGRPARLKVVLIHLKCYLPKSLLPSFYIEWEEKYLKNNL